MMVSDGRVEATHIIHLTNKAYSKSSYKVHHSLDFAYR